MGFKNIVIAPCGNRSLVFKDEWLKYKTEKEFDVCLLFYHEDIKTPSQYGEVEYFYHLKGFKYNMIFELLTNIHPEWITQYEYFYFLDDDIEIDTRQINKLFILSKVFDTYISCAALTADSYCSWPMFKQKPNHFCRYVGQIEVMSPVFNSFALQKCLPSFIENKSSWGMDSVWSKLLDYPKNKLIVFDHVNMRHIHPVGEGELYKKIGTDPLQDWKNITNKYNARHSQFEEYSKLYFIDESSNKLVYLLFKYKNHFAKLERSLKDSILKFIGRVKM